MPIRHVWKRVFVRLGIEPDRPKTPFDAPERHMKGSFQIITIQFYTQIEPETV